MTTKKPAPRTRAQVEAAIAKPAPGPDFSGETDTTPEDAVVTTAQVALLVDRCRRLAPQILAAQETIGSLTLELEKLTMVDIPDAMAGMKTLDLTLMDGTKVTVKPDIKVGITNENGPQAYAWLRENGHGASIKKDLIVDTRALDEKHLERLNKALEKLGVEADSKESIHNATLKSLVKELLERGVRPPATISLYEFKKAVIKEPKK